LAVIFIGGMHGVGKTTSCTHAAKTLNISHFSASQIIRNNNVSGSSDIEKRVVDLADNQRALIAGVQSILASEHQILLDGHFALQARDGIEEIPVRVFEMLRITGIVLFTDEPREIANRINQRDAIKYTTEAVAIQQMAEVKHASHVAQKLMIPLVTLKAFDAQGLVRAASAWLVRQ